MKDFSTYLTARARLLAAGTLLGSLSAASLDPAPTDDLSGLIQLLENQSDLVVETVAWEPSGGALMDFLWGRPLLFTGVHPQDPHERRDIFRALMRVSPEGKILGTHSRKNLTATRSADEFGLGSKGQLAWFGSRGAQGPSSITFLDLAGEKPPRSLRGRLQLGISRLLETGTWSGLGRSDVFSDAGEIVVTIGSSIVIESGSDKRTVSREDLFPRSEERNKDGSFRIVARIREPSPWLHWAADTGRLLVGSGAIAWAEGRAFSLWDNLHQATYSVTSEGADVPLPLPAPKKKVGVNPSWPPPPIDVGSPSKRGNGKWHPVENAAVPEAEPPLFYRTLIHPDRDRPYSELHLVAMDMRRLELGIGAGYEDPHPDTGPPGSGHIPDEIAPSVVATFNGAFKAIHGQYGMKAEGRLLVEPVDGAATVRVDAGGSAGFGTWTKEHSPKDVLAFRQNLDPLVAEGKVNPNKRKVWGDQLLGSGVAVERSALCYHSSGHILYGWATEATGESLAHGMAAAGCVYAIHLDMNPGHCAFIFNRVRSVHPLKATGVVLDSRMRVNPTRFVRWSPKDFFYVRQRRKLPKSDSISFQTAPGKGPAPTNIAAILLGKRAIGDLEIEIDHVDLSRFRFTIHPGSAETNQPVNPVDENPGAALIAWGLGHRTQGTRTGLTMEKKVLVPLHRSYASLIVEDGGLSLFPPAEPQTERDKTQIVQLPTLARAGTLTESARELGGKRARSAMCIDAAGVLWVARMTHDTPAPLAQALLDVGCDLVVEMDRGSHPPPLVERAGTDNPPHTGYDQTMLYGLEAPMKPRTHLF